MAQRPVEQEQERLLEEAIAVVKEQAFFMKKAIDNDNLRDSLKHGSNMICELRTSLLSPKNYYELYMHVFQELQHLGSFFQEPARVKRRMSELYESVQHAGNILPRLYLLITVGAAYIKSREAPAKDILADMTELCKGVQHPMRGLFLRYYLSQMCKDKLPDVGSEFEGEDSGSLEDAFDFLLTNFAESTRLWVRMQHQGAVKDRVRRERERLDLRVLVGANLVRLSQLEGMTVEYYKDTALPKIAEQVVVCKDALAQQYLLDCIILVFSDECHLASLDQFLSLAMKVQPGVDLNPVLVNLMTRLCNFLKQNPEALPGGTDLFDLFRTHIDEVVSRPLSTGATAGSSPLGLGDSSTSSATANGAGGSNPMTLPALLELLCSFLHFCLELFPERTEYIDHVLGSAATLVQRNKAALEAEEESDPDGPAEGRGTAVGAVVELLAAPLSRISLSIVDLAHYPSLMNCLSLRVRKKVAASMVAGVVASEATLSEPRPVERFFLFVSPLVSDEKEAGAPAAPPQTEADKEAFAKEQEQVARVVHLIKHEDTDVCFQMLRTAANAFKKGGPHRRTFVLPPLVTRALQLVPLVHARELHAAQGGGVQAPASSVKKVLQFAHTTCTELVQCNAELGLRFFLHCAITADKADLAQPGAFEPICYEFLTQALVCYEEELSDSRAQFQSLTLLVGTMVSAIHCLENDNWDTMAAKMAQHSTKLLRKQDQCRALLMASTVFWGNAQRRDAVRVTECLQKCLRIADVAMQSSNAHAILFVDILDKYIFYVEQKCDAIDPQVVGQLISLCAENLAFCDSETAEDARRQFKAALTDVQRASGDPQNPFYGMSVERLLGAHASILR
uniref:Vacuolar protein sorting-associated protein 35 n=1 Tax=Chromera velia CCMP2878 TaxID=1169474 RepID=A0A0G4IAI5_9ALVE|mmetsp:Transcript_17974/g.36498  ORF Transcript_17974/g.36498 Transcript_17974/m.36498 type:complete len:850 (+) Transcript_17974:251-2800(+)|eukprot:Cvel_12566.t1-p1 / transcript=Cvel_12566.t1 / gene=Cvel_12566 / organism=Chromera_velia_CCMP2878 / gene_product=Vacuolar protein sorting-associated protein 35B, putative / transcript_product=Vacuolar protein sorting-associated protein 35B, putative / location=Cvel_scaffold826:54109-63595(+) / protein_length=849 / sequence_SO=supercontig / SO=protein_coding / is_pseudo=false